MEIEFLKELGFREEEKDINKLKISFGKVEFDIEGRKSKITTPDLRYYWDGESFGLHISDCDFGDKELTSIFINLVDLINENMVIFYFSRTKIENMIFGDRVFNKLCFLNFSRNPFLQKLNLKIPERLEEFIISDCLKLKDLSLEISKSNLKKIDISNCSISQFPAESFDMLEYLNVQNNKLTEINIAKMTNLKYLFAAGNEHLNIVWSKKWIHRNLEMLTLDQSNSLISKDILQISQNSSDFELREKLKAYLKFEQKNEEEMVPINRYQIILIGNSTAGKTELRYKLLDEKRLDFDSTHGVQYFLKVIDGIEVMGFDFGGQDYYHGLHLPFFDINSHYILVWGNHKNKNWGSFEADSYYGVFENITVHGSEEKIEIENLLYPINYWLKSIQTDSERKNWHHYTTKSMYNENLNLSYIARAVKEGLVPADYLEESKINERVKSEPIIDIIQNVRAKTSEKYLNIKELKSARFVRVQDILSFDFDKKDVGNWLREKINNHPLIQKNSILRIVKNFGELLYKEGIIIIDRETISIKIKALSEGYIANDVSMFINSLINNKYLIDLGKSFPDLNQHYIVNIQKFTEYVYQVLSKELLLNDNNQGYFLKSEAMGRVLNTDPKIKEYVLSFLVKTDVIFEVYGSDKGDPKYVAPTYLPKPKEKIEILFIESFEEPDCEFEFHSFFHPNIILQVVKYYKEKSLLVEVENKIEYLLWKNLVIIYNNDKVSKNYLKLELLLPDEANPNRLPTFTISRSNKGYIKNDQFFNVFTEIKNILYKYTHTTKVRTPYGNYIDFNEVKNSLTEGKGKKSQFVHSGNVLYPKYDFRHFLGDEMDAPIKIFIAYSKYDDIYRKELRDHLYPGSGEGKFVVFDDREIDLGEKWHARLKKELEQSDIFILLISVKTLGTPYVMNVEIPEALKRFNSGNLKIIPILISPCDWTKTGLSNLNLFDKAQAISTEVTNFDFSKELSVNGRAEKWQEIVKILETLKP